MNDQHPSASGVAENAVFESSAASMTGGPSPLPDLAAGTRTNLASKLRWQGRFKVWGGQLLLAVVIIGGWQWFTAEHWVDPFTYGQPTGIVHRLYTLFRDGTAFGSYPEQILVTLQEAVYGFLIGAAAGILMGVSLGTNRYLSSVISPYIKVVNAIPRIVLGSIFVVAFGFGITGKMLLAAVLVFFVVFFNAFQGVREVDPNVIANARVLGAKPLHIIRHVTLPSAMTWIIASLHTAFGFAIVGALVAEILGSEKGLGLVITTAQGTFDADGVFAVMLTVAVITLVAEFILTRLERRLLAWRPQSRSDAPAI
ncbi:MAG: binding-protein-dependent transport system inner rane component [Marmoricola sp.]|nr:binding-protein-dependent transport system inner rane component [Marmoricola sp.]